VYSRREECILGEVCSKREECILGGRIVFYFTGDLPL